MPTLNWIGKQAVVDHHRKVPLRLLECDPELSAGDPEAGNLLVEGDNLEALRALLPRYKGQVKCIYIDPPYNTGNEEWVYNDNVNDPRIHQWLGEVVGREAEDLCRHDKWLCMMYPRLALLKQFLRPDGVIFVSIGEDEVARLYLLLEEVFGETNHVGTFVWKRRSSSAMRGTPVSTDHEYVLAFSVSAPEAQLYGLEKGVEGYPHVDDVGHYASTDLTIGMGMDLRPKQYYCIINPRTRVGYGPNPERVWRFEGTTMQDVIARDLVIWPDEQGGAMTRPRFKTRYNPESEKPRPVSTWIESNTTNEPPDVPEDEDAPFVLTSEMNQAGGRVLSALLGGKSFPYPKPVSLVRSLVRAATRPGDLVMDSFCGSATTGHAVLSLSDPEEEDRRFILIEIDPDTARAVASERLRRLVETGSRGGFRYCRLGHTMFDAHGNITENVPFADLARYVYLIEAGVPTPKRPRKDCPLLGVHEGRAVYLLYNGVLGDKRPAGGNVLTQKVLDSLPAHDGPKVVYGEACRLGPRTLALADVTFKQTPYALQEGQ